MNIDPKTGDGLPRMTLLPPRALTAVARVLTFGANKHGTSTWRHAFTADHTAASLKYADAALRHIFAWLGGEERDRESGEHHLAHVACNVLFILDEVER